MPSYLFAGALCLLSSAVGCNAFISPSFLRQLRGANRFQANAAMRAFDEKASLYQTGAQRNICLGVNDLTPIQKNLALYANAISNDVLNKMIIKYEPLLLQLKGDFSRFEAEIRNIWEKTSAEGGDISDAALAQTQQYLQALHGLADGNLITGDNLGRNYGTGVNAFMKYLQEAAECSPETNVCMSMMDELNDGKSLSRTLNVASNCVVRAMKHCDFKGRSSLADAMEYNLGHKGTYPVSIKQPETCFYTQALISLLREGKTATEAAITFPGPKSYPKAGTSDISAYIPGISSQIFQSPPRIRLTEPYRSVFYRVVELSQPDKSQYTGNKKKE